MPGTGKAMGKDATFEGATKFALDVGPNRVAWLRATGKFKPSRQVGLHGALEQGALGLAAAIARDLLLIGFPG